MRPGPCSITMPVQNRSEIKLHTLSLGISRLSNYLPFPYLHNISPGVVQHWGALCLPYHSCWLLPSTKACVTGQSSDSFIVRLVSPPSCSCSRPEEEEALCPLLEKQACQDVPMGALWPFKSCPTRFIEVREQG